MSSRSSLGLALAVMIVAGYAVFAAKGWQWKAALFPLAIGIPLFALAAIEAVWSFLDKRPAREETEDVSPPVLRRRTLQAWGWIGAFLAMILLLGFLYAVPLFVLAYLKLQGRESWLFAVPFSAAVWGAFYGIFDRVLHLPFPAGWALEWLGLA